MTEDDRPFAGIRIVDFTQVLAGPFCTYQLALLGADVIKVERPEGDEMRRTPLSREWAERGLAPAFQAVNGNKRSIALDLRQEPALEIIRKLIAGADVVVENFRPGVMDRLGLGAEALKALNPSIIYASISGFGHTGPDRLEAGYDGRIQATSGIMAITGHPELGPTRAGFAVCDILSGMTAAFGISGALFQRSRTGRYQRVDVSMLDATLAFLSGQIADFNLVGHRQGLSGNQAVSRRVTANLFKAGDSHILLAVNTEGQYRCLMTGLGRTEVFDDPRFADWFTRKTHEAALRAIIEDALATDSPANWEQRLNAAGAPCAQIRPIEDAIALPQVAARGVLQAVETPAGPINFMTNGFRLDYGGAQLERMAPTLGQDTDAILADLGYDPPAIAALRAKGAI